MMKKELGDYIEHNREAIQETWNTLHAIPETAFQEKKTSAYLAGELRKCGFEVTEGLGKTGVLGIFDGGKPGPKVGLRADMDALMHTDKSGKVEVVHSCGHDANCTEVLWAAKAFVAVQPSFSGKLHVLFQPAEEGLGGAKEIIKTGVLKELEYFISTHLRPLEELPLGRVIPAVLHGASSVMEIFITGEDAHGARPHQGVNAIEAATGIIQAVQALHLDPTISHSAKVTKIQSGSNPFNVIPSTVSMGFDLRAQTNELMNLQKERMKMIADGIGKLYGASITYKVHDGVPAATKCPELIAIAAEAIKGALGENAVVPALSTAGGEDFHEYPLAIPGLKSTVIGVGADLTPGLHKANMKFNPEALMNGAKALVSIVAQLLR